MSSRRRHGNPPKLMSVFEACEIASAMIRAAGFELRYQSAISETRYFGWPGREGTLRVSAHKRKRGANGLPPIIARVTFHDASEPGTVSMDEVRMDNTVANAIGRYMLRSAEPPFQTYRCMSGAW